jgi:hypothetical protein
MRKQNRIPPALKHGIYSGIGLLPTENAVKFRKFKKQRFADLALTGPLEEDIGDKIVCLEWRLQNLFTYDLAKRARARHSSIYSQVNPPRPEPYSLPLLIDPNYVEPEPPSPKELAARRKTARNHGKAGGNDRSRLQKIIVRARDQIDGVLCHSRTISAASG